MTETTRRTKDYSEPSASSVTLDAPPAWLNLDGIISYDERERIKDLIEEGRELLARAAAWGREAVPLTIHSWPESTRDQGDELHPLLDHLCGIDQLEELTYLFTIAAGHRHDIDNDRAKLLRDERPELGLHTVDNDDPYSKDPTGDTLAVLLHEGWSMTRTNGQPVTPDDPICAAGTARLTAMLAGVRARKEAFGAPDATPDDGAAAELALRMRARRSGSSTSSAGP
jgi:hypothetical protein